jgi:PAS domain S-box-containing protein
MRGARREGSELAATDRERPDVYAALAASDHALTVSDPTRPDNPLVWVNPAFERLSGYRAAEVVGRNCRMLQGPDTDPAAVARIGAAVAAGVSVVETVLNYRPDGSTWHNRLAIAPVREEGGQLTGFAGLQTDVTDLVGAATQRDAARQDADEAWGRLRMLSDASTVLSGTLDPDVAVQRLTELVVPQFADWCSILVVDPEASTRGETARMTLTHRDPNLSDVVARVLEIYRPRTDDETPQSQVLRTGRPVLLADVDGDYIDTAARDDELAAAWHQLGMRSCIVVPLPARDRYIGCLTAVTAASGRVYAQADVAYAQELGRRAGLALDNARLYAAEHTTAVILQRSLLGAIPELPGVEISATYEPGADRAEVGGDWYDVLPLPGGSVGLAVGDVMGHNMDAAAAMGQVRSMLRAYAWEDPDPGRVLRRLNDAVRGLDIAAFATCVYARVDPGQDSGRRIMRWANAGHPPPLLHVPGADVQVLDAGRQPAIGVAGHRAASDSVSSVELPAGSTVVLYTDGLIEDHDRDPDVGLAQLRAAFTARITTAGTGRRLARELTATAPVSQQDDVCLLVARFG